MQRRAFLNSCLGSLVSLRAAHTSGKKPVSAIQPSLEETDVLVKVLGTAQDGGFPAIGCYCKNCRQARLNPDLSRLISSLAIFDLKEEKSYLIDATPDIRVQAKIIHEWKPIEKSGRQKAPDGIFLTHAHIGHYTGLMFYGYEAMSAYKLPVYCSSNMGSFLTSNGPWSQLVKLENVSLHTLFPGKKILLSPHLSLTAFKVPHRNEYSDTLGFVLSGKKRKLIYIPDIKSWEVWNRPITKEVAKVDIALLDGSFFSPEELPGRDLSKIGHPFIQTSLRVLGETVKKLKKDVYFTHLNHSNLAHDPKGKAIKEIEQNGCKLASDGMEFFL
ncbi:MBL fold metallo-hydrolase [Acidobacteriota bacterium]